MAAQNVSYFVSRLVTSAFLQQNKNTNTNTNLHFSALLDDRMKASNNINSTNQRHLNWTSTQESCMRRGWAQASDTQAWARQQPSVPRTEGQRPHGGGGSWLWDQWRQQQLHHQPSSLVLGPAPRPSAEGHSPQQSVRHLTSLKQRILS